MILVDVSEPDNIVKLLQQAAPVTTSPLNQNRIADYFFGNYDGKRIQFGRVQAGELVGDIDSMEDELKRYYNSADETNQIIEGLLSPVKLYMKDASSKVHDHSVQRFVSARDLGAKIFTYPVQPSGFIEHGHSFTTARMSELYAWIYRLSQLGVNTYYTNNWEEHSNQNRYYCNNNKQFKTNFLKLLIMVFKKLCNMKQLDFQHI